jgi:lytic cellulose monooxygenase (C1-hydroxylating)
VNPNELSGSQISCHRDSSNAKLYATVAAGSELTLTWNTWPDSHKGPIFDYLAPCNGECTSVDKNSLRFFKIAQKGQISKGAGNGQTGRVCSVPSSILSTGSSQRKAD